eukprot:6491020-Amphidinium_carterae.1
MNFFGRVSHNMTSKCIPRAKSRFTIVYCDASFAHNGGRSRSGCSIYLVLPSSLGEGPQHVLLSWSSRRQTLTAASAPEAEVAALAESLMPGIVLQDACRTSHILA